MTRNADTALLTFSIGPVHSFIAQARRIADVWAGSQLLSDLIGHAVIALQEAHGEMVFPSLECAPNASDLPDGLPNRFVSRVPLPDVPAIAAAMHDAVNARWLDLVARAKQRLADHGIAVAPRFDAQAAALLEVAWSHVPETSDYASAAIAGARQFAASRMYRPFAQVEQSDALCAVCGQRTALPDGITTNIKESWLNAEKKSREKQTVGFFRYDQTRLCLVCATKRLYPLVSGETKSAQFLSFRDFEPRANGEDAPVPYCALVTLDGDHMGRILGWEPSRLRSGTIEEFHRRVSSVLTSFADSLRTAEKAALNVEAIGYSVRGATEPQLIYAGGEDVLLICDPRDGIPLADAIAWHYESRLQSELADVLDDTKELTMSAAVLFAHTKDPAGGLLHDVEVLLKEQAKCRQNRNALAIRLAKRGGPPVEVAFRWNRSGGGKSVPVERLDRVVQELRDRGLGSTQLFNFAADHRKLKDLHLSGAQWTQWLAMRLGRGGKSAPNADALAAALAPWFVDERVESLRIARFLGAEMEAGTQ